MSPRAIRLLALAALAEDDVLAGQDRVLELGQHGLVVAEDSRQEWLVARTRPSRFARSSSLTVRDRHPAARSSPRVVSAGRGVAMSARAYHSPASGPVRGLGRRSAWVGADRVGHRRRIADPATGEVLEEARSFRELVLQRIGAHSGLWASTAYPAGRGGRDGARARRRRGSIGGAGSAAPRSGSAIGPPRSRRGAPAPGVPGRRAAGATPPRRAGTSRPASGTPRTAGRWSARRGPHRSRRVPTAGTRSPPGASRRASWRPGPSPCRPGRAHRAQPGPRRRSAGGRSSR